jgi:hypothetical protein
MKRLAQILLLALSLTAVSCFPEGNGGNGNLKSLVNTQWASSTGNIVLSFEEDDWAFFSLYGTVLGSGQYQYNSPKGEVTFDVFFVITDDTRYSLIENHQLQIQITDAKLTSSNQMTIYFHELAETEEYAVDLQRQK